MKVLVYSAKPFEIPLLQLANSNGHQLEFTTDRLTSQSAHQALNFEGISIFSADDASEIVLEKLWDFGVRHIALRSAGYDNIKLKTAFRLGFNVANAPDYSPYAIAEHAIALLLAYNRKIVTARQQTSNYNFSLDQLIGFDVHAKTVGVLGAGKIGTALIKILHGFGCHILAHDLEQQQTLEFQYGVRYVSKIKMAKEAQLIFICLPLTAETHYLIDTSYINQMGKKPILVNVARGAIVQTTAVLNALDDDRLAGYVTDVYEKEEGVFFYNHSQSDLRDSLLSRLLNHPKVLLTPHQGFATAEALTNIANATLRSFDSWATGKQSPTTLQH